MKKLFNITPLKGERIGQTLYKFIYWLENKYQTDTYHVPDTELEKIYKVFIKENQQKK